MTTTLRESDLRDRVGQEIAVSPWHEVAQERIDLFARATDDHQWIHVDPARAAKGPFGGTIAHGFLTLSLLPRLLDSALTIAGERSMGVNYGLNRVRFTSPLPSGGRVRARFTLAAYEDVPGGAQLTWNVTVEREGAEKPCLVAEWLVRRYA